VKEQTLARIEQAEQAVVQLKERVNSLNPYRNTVIEEVATELEKFREPFGLDTVASFAIFVRNMKK
jgi:hypothetical protein